MAFLVRKISRAKWPNDVCELCNIPGDTVSDLRTSSNTLSLWRIETEDDLEKAALALSASSKTERIEMVSVAWIPEELFTENCLSLENSSVGDTVVFDLENTHCDVCNLTYASLGIVAQTILREIIKEERYKRFTKGHIKKILTKAYLDDRIEESRCKPSLIQEIKKALENQ